MTSLLSSTPCVSVIVPVYNAAHFVSAALDSVLAQTFQDFEILVVDDGSTDDLAGVLAAYKDNIAFLHQENAGPAAARNRGIRAARGEFIAFLDADDLWAPEKLELQLARLREHPESGVCFTECLYFDENGTREANLWRQVPPPEQMFEALLTGRFVHLSSFMVRRKCLDEVGVFDESLIGCEDYNLYLRLARWYGFQFLPQPLFKSRSHDGKLSSNLAQMSRDEVTNLDKISALFPELKLSKRRIMGENWFRFGQYYFARDNFIEARNSFARSIASSPDQPLAYAYWFVAALPTPVRELSRRLLRVVRRTSQNTMGNARSNTSNSTETATSSSAIAPAPSTKARKTPLRVMQVTWSFVAGGSENYALTLSRHLDRTRFTPLMCALDEGGALEPEIRSLKIPYYIMHRRPGVQLGVMWRMFRLFRRKRVRVVHTHHFNQLFYSFLGAKLCGARLIHTEHSVETYEKPQLCTALRILARGCYRVTAIGEDVAHVLHKKVGIPEGKLQILRAGIDLNAFNVTREDARAAMGLATEGPVAAIVARLSPEKNHQGLLEAWAQVVKAIPVATLLIAGGGPEEAKLKSEIERLALQERVKMLGVRRDVANVLAACDVFVLNSDREGLPLVILEAFAAARPVVATAVGDIPLVVRDGETGTLVPPKNPSALAEALIQSLRDPERARHYGEAGRCSIQGFGLAPMIEAHQALYET